MTEAIVLRVRPHRLHCIAVFFVGIDIRRAQDSKRQTIVVRIRE